jgi:hypothetical protein
MVLADSQKTPKRQDCVSHLAAHLVDHQAFDPTDAMVAGPVNSSAFDAVTRNER